jgi:hypothetical protein
MSIRTLTLATAAATALALLTPMAASAQRGGGNTPNGSYGQSCSNAYVSGGRLYAQCRDTRRNTRASSIELSACAVGDIANDNGLLICTGGRGRFETDGGGNGGGNNGGGWGGGNGGGNGGGGWGGGNGGRNSITLYRDANYRGESQTFQGEVYNLSSTGLNDQVSSMQFRGAWEACTDSNFRGQCQVFEDDVRNLDRWGMNDRISSIRPLRRGGR